MADLTLSTTKLVSGRISSFRQLLTAALPGQPVYRDADTGKSGLADATDTAKSKVTGVVLVAGDADHKAVVAKIGARIDLGVALVKGETYALSDSGTAGRIRKKSELTATATVSEIGIAESTSVLLITLNNTGIVL